MVELLSLRISTITSLTLDSARIILHMWDTMRVWIRLLSFMELKVEDGDEDDVDDDDDFNEKS